MNNYQLCNEISDRVVHHFVHCIETHGRHVQYLKFLETIVKADGKYVKKCQDKVMTEVRMTLFSRHFNPHDGSPASTDHLNNVKHVSVITVLQYKHEHYLFRYCCRGLISTSTHNLHSLQYVYYLLAGAVCSIRSLKISFDIAHMLH